MSFSNKTSLQVDNKLGLGTRYFISGVSITFNWNICNILSACNLRTYTRIFQSKFSRKIGISSPGMKNIHSYKKRSVLMLTKVKVCICNVPRPFWGNWEGTGVYALFLILIMSPAAIYGSFPWNPLISLKNEIKRLKVSKITSVVLFSVDGLFVEKSIILRGSSVETDWSV